MIKIQPKFLNNQPIGDDLFEGKSQEKIGVVIADIIKNKNFQIHDLRLGSNVLCSFCQYKAFHCLSFS